jgi:ribosome recycling factor
MYKELIAQKKRDFDSIFEHVKNEFGAIRVGRANPSLVEGIQVEYMGSKLRLKELATITTPEPRIILIQPWDKNAIPLIDKAIKESSLGLNPASDSQGIRLTIPPLTEERRKEYSRLMSQKAEEGRIKARQIREDILRKIQTEVKEKRAREDDLFKGKDELQKVMDDFNKKIDDLVAKKNKELMA